MGQAAVREESNPAEEALRRLASALSQGVVLLQDDRIVWVNDQMVEMTGWGSSDALLGTELQTFLVDTGQGLPVGSRPRNVACGLQRACGQELAVECRPVSPQLAPGTDAWLIEDADHVRRLEEETLYMSRELHRLNREVVALRENLHHERDERDDLLTLVSHELRTPITVILGYNRLLLSGDAGPLNDDQRRFLKDSSKSCQKLDDFVGKLLEGARRPRSMEALEVSNDDLEPVVVEVTSALRGVARESALEIHLDLDPNGCRARFDRTAFEQILINLIGNAIRYAVQRIEVSTRRLRTQDRELIEISVSDDGPGVPAADRVRIFDSYVQVGDEERSGGLGLGLAICKRLVEGHGGAISVCDRPTGGARFAFTLPGAES
jgi:signal transduction histidine kinase